MLQILQMQQNLNKMANKAPEESESTTESNADEDKTETPATENDDQSTGE